MKKGVKASILLTLILGLGLVYLGGQVYSLQNRVDKLDWLVIEAGVTIENESGVETKAVHLTRGATALEALQRTATVETKFFSGLGLKITTINGVKENQSTNKYWMTYRLNENEGEWKLLNIGA